MSPALRFIRFFGVMEPGRNYLSLSKVYLWVMMFLVTFTAIFHADNSVAMLTAVGAQFLATMNYGIRRHYNSKENTDAAISSQPAAQSS